MCFLKVERNTNKRLRAMSKPSNVVHSGWMTKSPPEKKIQSPLKIFRAVFVSLFPQKWKQRFFVLHKPSGSLPDQYELSYYNSEQCSKKKGSIDLEQCEQIIESIDSDQYPYLLAIKTVCRGKVRTYYLATNTEEDMGTWVQCLCRVCGLKQDDTPTNIPDAHLSLHGLPGGATASVVVGGGSVGGASVSVCGGAVGGGGSSSSARSAVVAMPSLGSQPHVTPPRASNVTASTSSTNSHPVPPASPQSYVFLNECTTGTAQKHGDRYGRTESIDSVPEYHAPPPPAKRGPQLATIDNDSVRGSLHDSVFDVYDHPPGAAKSDGQDRPRSGVQELYDRPRSSELHGSQVSLDDDAFHKDPPCANGHGSLHRVTKQLEASNTVDLHAKVPLPMPRRSPHSVHSSLSERPVSVSSSGRPAAENYDIPPTRPISTSSQEVGLSSSVTPTPPLRPPKPHSLMAQSPYQNLPPGSKNYENSLSAVPSAPPKHCGTAFSYDVPRSTPVVSPPRDLTALDIAPPAPAFRNCGPTAGHAYLNTVPGRSGSPLVPPLPDTYLRNGVKAEPDDLVYADMDSPALGLSRPAPTPDLTLPDMSASGGRHDSSVVPPLVPRPPARASTLPSQKGASGAVADPDPKNKERTKSFSRSDHSSASPSLPLRLPPSDSRRLPLPAPIEFASSSEDDDDLSVDGNNTHHDLSILRMSTVPAAPDLDTEPELKYLDLALDMPHDPSRPQAAASHSTPTEYREIDFLKTRALQDIKKVRDMNK